MQDRYAGDVGDFSKFALMRQLEALSSRPMGLIWYRHPDESHTNDGRHIGYLSHPSWQNCDRALVDHLSQASNQPTRSIQFLEGLPLFRQSPKTFGESCHPFSHAAFRRDEWFDRATKAVEGCDIVFTDPDNGIRLTPRALPSPKHMERHEFVELAKLHPLLVAYHHFDRSQSHVRQMQLLRDELSSDLPGHKIEVLRYRRISPRAYVCAIQPPMVEGFETVMRSLTTSPWSYHWERL